MIYLRNFSLSESSKEKDYFPFSLPVWEKTDQVSFTTPVTMFVGENGSGKSTVLETLALAINMITIGSEAVNRDKSLRRLKELSYAMKLVWNKKTKRGFFLRAEDFFGYVKRMNQIREEMNEELERVEREYKDRSEFARIQARTPFQGTLGDLNRRYGQEGLDARSHGESFLALFQNRFVPEGLYLLDEPEVPLSPLRQLTLISMLREMEQKDSQFIIATHSPILLAYPGAVIYQFGEDGIQQVDYEDLEHVNITRDFLQNPSSFLRHL